MSSMFRIKFGQQHYFLHIDVLGVFLCCASISDIEKKRYKEAAREFPFNEIQPACRKGRQPACTAAF